MDNLRQEVPIVRVQIGKVPVIQHSFCICPIFDFELTGSRDLFVPLVHNIPERTAFGAPGKPAGWGLPGGGVNDERGLENKEEAAGAEVTGETGLVIQKGPILLFSKHQVVVSNLSTGQPKRWIHFEAGKRPPVTINPNFEVARENWTHIFVARVNWETSRMRPMLLKAKNIWLERGEMTSEDFQEQVSVSFEGLSPEDVNSLDIEEKKEIDGVGIFSVNFLKSMYAEYSADRNRPPAERAPREAYISHLSWVKEAMDQIAEGGIPL